MISKKTAFDVGMFLVSQIVLWYGVKWAVAQMDPLRKKKEESSAQAAAIFKRLGMNQVELNEYEQILAAEIVCPEDIQDTFQDIGGLQPIIDQLREAVIYPLTMPHLFQQGGRILGPPKGVLLYGPPGCGKTMLARALAKESGAMFINLHVSTLTEKWFGESQKLVRALFTLAAKLEPTIIFIDEIDSFLRERQSSDHEAMGMMKAEFMALWDGLGSRSTDRVMLLGATNRYHDIDKAILRRLPKRFAVSLPDEEQRRKVLTVILKEVAVGGRREVLIKQLAAATQSFSCSDLKELCRNASMIPVREYIRSVQKANSKVDLQTLDPLPSQLRPLTLQDFMEAVKSESLNQQPADKDELE